MPITDEGESQEFVSLEIKQDLVAGTLEVTQREQVLPCCGDKILKISGR
jgi:hypothetical protein